MRVVMCASEAVPFAKTGGLADVLGALPLALEKLGAEVVMILPKYKEIKAANPAVIGKNIKVYFIENEAYFSRAGLYGDKAGDYKDNLERFSYYCKKSLELLKEINFKPDVIHCHDWQAALILVYLKALYAKDDFYKNTKTLLTIHNLGYQGLFAAEEFKLLCLPKEFFTMDTLEFHNRINILKGGIIFSTLINTVSPTYARQIQSDELGFGLEGVLSARQKSLFGILNGLDYAVWNPLNDKVIKSNFSKEDLSGKAIDKADLQKFCGLPVDKDVPLVGMVSRLAEHKGFDLIAVDIDQICKMKLQFVLLGTGQAEYHRLFEKIALKYPKVISLHLKFDDQLAHKIYAGSDIFLMPSKYEPCGLGQLISLGYGSIPLVFKTGGLADTVTSAHGFVFEHYQPPELIKALSIALKSFEDKAKWQKLIKNAIDCDFSWEKSSLEYFKLYEKAAKAHG